MPPKKNSKSTNNPPRAPYNHPSRTLYIPTEQPPPASTHHLLPDVSTVAAAALPAMLAMAVERAITRALAQLTRVAAVARVSGLGIMANFAERLHRRQRRRHDLAQRQAVVRFRAAQELCEKKRKKYRGFII